MSPVLCNSHIGYTTVPPWHALYPAEVCHAWINGLHGFQNYFTVYFILGVFSALPILDVTSVFSLSSVWFFPCWELWENNVAKWFCDKQHFFNRCCFPQGACNYIQLDQKLWESRACNLLQKAMPDSKHIFKGSQVPTDFKDMFMLPHTDIASLSQPPPLFWLFRMIICVYKLHCLTIPFFFRTALLLQKAAQ